MDIEKFKNGFFVAGRRWLGGWDDGTVGPPSFGTDMSVCSLWACARKAIASATDGGVAWDEGAAWLIFLRASVTLRAQVDVSRLAARGSANPTRLWLLVWSLFPPFAKFENTSESETIS